MNQPKLAKTCPVVEKPPEDPKQVRDRWLQGRPDLSAAIYAFRCARCGETVGNHALGPPWQAHCPFNASNSLHYGFRATTLDLPDWVFDGWQWDCYPPDVDDGW